MTSRLAQKLAVQVGGMARKKKTTKAATKKTVPNKVVPKSELELDNIEIHTFRGQQVVLDYDVARLFGTGTKQLNQQVARNSEKFGDDFAFRLDTDEFAELKSQNVTSSGGHGGTRYPPRVFTEHGVVMVATVLRSPQAIHASRFIVRAFVAARQNAIAKRKRRNTPPADVTKLAMPLAHEMRTELMTKVHGAIGRVLDAIVDPDEDKTVREEAREIAAEGLKGLKAFLKQPGVRNEKSLAEVRKIIAEAENLDAATAGKRTENRHRELALLAKQLRLVLEAQNYVETGSVDGLLQVLSDLESPG